MKKLLCILLTLLMLLGLTTVAFAAGDDATLIINDSDGRTYAGYKLLNLTTSLKANCGHNAADSHNDGCYNYAYTVNEKYRAILQDEVFANGGNYLWEGSTKPATAVGVKDDQILKYFSNQTGDNTSATDHGTLRNVADRLYRAIQTAKIEADAASLTSATTSLAQGYWLIADISNLTEYESNSLVMLDTHGESAITISPKTALPTFEKKVKDINDTKDAAITDNAWQDSADHDIGDIVPFKLTATVATNVLHYDSYELVFHDTLSEGLTLVPGSFKVHMYSSKASADADTDLSDGKDVTDSFKVTTTGLTDDCTFEVSCENVKAIEGFDKDYAFVVYYEATLNDAAVIGFTGNPNEAYLEFSNNPYGDDIGKTEKDKVIVFTYQLTVNKTDADGKALEGAGFTLYKKNSAHEYIAIGEELKGDDMTTFNWKGLDDGDYKLVETTVPAGYNKMNDIEFTISAEHQTDSTDPQLTSLNGGLMGTGAVDTGAITKEIVNNTGTVLPETGARGTMLLIGGGAMFVLLAGVFMITRKKMSIYED